MPKNERMFAFDADVFQETFDAYTDDLRKVIHKAVGSTLAKLRRRARTWLSTEIRKTWNIKKKDLDKKIKVKIGGLENDYFEMIIKGTAIPLSYFSAKHFSGKRVITRTKGYQKNKRSRFQGVQVEIKKGRKTRLPNAFIQASSSGHIMVLRRKGGDRYPLEMKAVISPASIFSNDSVDDRFSSWVDTELPKMFSRELDFRLSQEGYI